ncbi:hypothetical protein [Streptomyces sp. NPDC088785]|uniref:hypothetical protein n=1 Tax=Streptomyces sp. NPDC088785 TaxID=3365897 RepID=UPI0038008361
MRLGKALATGIAEEAPREADEVAAEREAVVEKPESKGRAAAAEPIGVPAVR